MVKDLVPCVGAGDRIITGQSASLLIANLVENSGLPYPNLDKWKIKASVPTKSLGQTFHHVLTFPRKIPVGVLVVAIVQSTNL